MDLTYYFLLLYVLPMVICLVINFLDEEIETIRDFLNEIWFCIVPLLNIILILAISTIYLEEKIKINERWQKFLNTKIK